MHLRLSFIFFLWFFCTVSCVLWSSEFVDSPDYNRPCSSNTSRLPPLHIHNTKNRFDMFSNVFKQKRENTYPLFLFCLRHRLFVFLNQIFHFWEMVCSSSLQVPFQTPEGLNKKLVIEIGSDILLLKEGTFCQCNHYLVATLMALFFSCSNSCLSFSAYSCNDWTIIRQDLMPKSNKPWSLDLHEVSLMTVRKFPLPQSWAVCLVSEQTGWQILPHDY